MTFGSRTRYRCCDDCPRDQDGRCEVQPPDSHELPCNSSGLSPCRSGGDRPTPDETNIEGIPT